VRVSNEPAKSLYQKQGYKEVTVRKRYYPDGEDALIMQKNLTVEDE
jgi:ribosomal-protein-alanine N-acetyltransferase